MKKENIPGITERYLQIMTEAIQEGLANSKTDFARRVGEHQQNLSTIEKGGRTPTIDQLVNACVEFGYSANWLLLNTGDKKMKKTEMKPLDLRVNDLESEVVRIKRQLKKLVG